MPWTEGRRKAFHQVEGFYRASAPSVCDSPGACRLAEDDRLALKLFSYWLYRWESADLSADGRTVAESISAGRGFVRGGNPLFDLVRADALCAPQNRAADGSPPTMAVAFAGSPSKSIVEMLPMTIFPAGGHSSACI